MTDPEQRLLDLNQRLQKGREHLAVLQAREQEKKIERDQLLVELKAAGINTDHPEEELERLDREIEAAYQEMDNQITNFETKLGLREGPPMPGIRNRPGPSSEGSLDDTPLNSEPEEEGLELEP